MPSPDVPAGKGRLRGGKISAHFRNISILLFVIVSVLIVAVMLVKLGVITDSVSRDYATLYSANAVGALNTYLGGEIALLKKASSSARIIEWFDDEQDPQKMAAAFEELFELSSALSGNRIYICIDRSLSEYAVGSADTGLPPESYATVNPDSADDAWYFDCKESELDYLLNADSDKERELRRVWLNYKVTRGGTVLGALSVSLDFSDMVARIFSDYDKNSVRGLVIDQYGVIQMDSYLTGSDEFLNTSNGGLMIADEVSDQKFRGAVSGFLADREGHFTEWCAPVTLKLSYGAYHYATITPLVFTTWSVVTLYNSSSLFNVSELLPLILIMLAMLLLYIVALGLFSRRFIFAPFEMLIESISHIKMNMKEHIFGIDRRDELGVLARTVQDMKDSLIDALGKVHLDGLTGIYNRRYFDESLESTIRLLSRSGGTLSLLMLDVDYFKRYNDAYGHSAGDACLIAVAEALSGSVKRADDFVARYGGEEFAVVLPNTDESAARKIAERMIAAVRAKSIPHSESDAADCVTVSVGATTGLVLPQATIDDFVTRADEALYSSKQNGRNRLTFFGLV